MADVFISYARVERDVAERIARRLEAQGLSVFIDVDGLDGGDVFSAKLDYEVKNSGAVLGLWSPTALSRPWVLTECDIGQHRQRLVPAAIKPFDRIHVPASFWNVQYIDLTRLSDSADDPNWRKLMQSLARTLDKPELTPQGLPVGSNGSRGAIAPDASTAAAIAPAPMSKIQGLLFVALVHAAINKETISGKALYKLVQTGPDIYMQSVHDPMIALNHISAVLTDHARRTQTSVPFLMSLVTYRNLMLPPLDSAARAWMAERQGDAKGAEFAAQLASDRETVSARLQAEVFEWPGWLDLHRQISRIPMDAIAFKPGLPREVEEDGADPYKRMLEPPSNRKLPATLPVLGFLIIALSALGLYYLLTGNR